MRTEKNVTILDILWEGPLSFEDAKKASKDRDFGLYQIYGTHAIFGPDSLLYVGLSRERTFSVRLPEHEHMIKWQSSPVQIHLGRFGGIDGIKSDVWGEMIARAEDLLIYFCTPPYNSRQISGLRDFDPIVVLNFGNYHRLPYMVSNLWEKSPVAEKDFQLFAERQGL